MKPKEIRQLAENELAMRVDETRKQILEHRLQRASNKLTNTAAMRTARKTLARLLTIESEERRKAGK